MTKKRDRKIIAAHPEGIKLLIEAKADKQNYNTGKPWNYTDINTKTGISTKTISKFFQGIAIELQNAVAIAKALDLKIEDIVDRDEYERLTTAKSKSISKHQIDWRKVCCLMLEKHPWRQHATEEDFELDIYVPLGLIKRKQQQRRPVNLDLPMEDVYKLEAKEEITRQFKHNQFLEHIGLSAKQAESTKSIAIIGEPGAGKSTLIEKIAKEIDEQNQGLPICISLANLEGLTIEEYLEQKWLKDALLIIKELVPQAE
ncbi:MAG: HEAT repeat domain-containing protein, partial [Xenococcaceae cyanobacterium]